MLFIQLAILGVEAPDMTFNSGPGRSFSEHRRLHQGPKFDMVSNLAISTNTHTEGKRPSS